MGKGRCGASLQMSDEQLSKCQGGPLAFLWSCLLHVEVLFCCMRRSAVSLACSEPGWERWREGTAPTLRLWPGVRISLLSPSSSLNSECSLHPGFPFTLVALPLRDPSNSVIVMDRHTSVYPNDPGHCIGVQSSDQRPGEQTKQAELR